MSKANKTLIILTPGFPKDETDTTCLPYLQNFTRELNEQFPLLEIVVLAFDYPFISNTYQWKKNEVISFNGWKKKGLGKLLTWMRTWKAMKKIKRDSNVIGLLSLWCSECAYLGNRFAKRNHLSHYCWVLGQDAKKENRYVSRIKPSAGELIALSDFIQKEFEKNHHIQPKHIIPFGIMIDEFSKEDPARDIDVLGVGSLIELKQYDLFIEMINTLKQHLPAIKAMICGKGPEEGKLKLLIEKYHLQKNIILTGELPHAEILKLMKRSKVFLHTSNYEGFGTVFIEALYAGCHTISFVQSMNDDIEHWHIAKTTEEMLEMTEAVLSNPATRYNPVLPFPMEETVKKIMHLYNYKEASIS